MNLFSYIDSFEKAAAFWLIMTGLTFLAIIIGMELSDCIMRFWVPTVTALLV